MTSLEYKRTRILEASEKLFLTYGYKRVSMEEIAKSAGIGKGTLYQLFSSKQELMLETVEAVGKQMSLAVAAIMADEAISPIEKLRMFLRTVSERLSSVRSETLKELETDFPDAFEKILENRQRIIVGNLTEILRQGKQAGVFDPKLDEKLAAHIVIGAADHFSQASVLSQFGALPEQIFSSILSVILKGCLTPEYRGSI